MSSDMTVAVLLRLVDKLSGPAQKATAGLKGIATGAKAIVPASNAAGGANQRLGQSLATVGRQGAHAASGIRQAGSASSSAASQADRAAAAFKRMGVAAQGAFAKIVPAKGLATIENYTRAQERLHARMSRAQSGLMTGGIIGGMVGFPMKRAADYELSLTRLGNTAQYQGPEFLARIGALDKRFRADARETRQYAADILAGVENLVARGMDQAEALGGSRLIGKAATATGTENEDLSNMYYALRMNLGIDEASMPKAFDIATQAGKLGGFELKNMAKWFPELTVGYSSMGIKGDQVGQKALANLSAMLQVAREGAATPDKAANNLANVIQKMMIPETRKKFEKAMGIDFAKSIQGAVQQGEDPIMHLLGLVSDFMANNDDNIFLLGDLIADRQALDALRALLTKREKIDEIARKSLEAEDVINRDFDRVSRTFAMRAKGLAIAADNLANTLMQGPMGEGKGVMGWMEDTFNALDRMAQRHPRITGALMNIGVGLLGFSLASRAFAFVANGVALGALGIIGTFWKFNAAGRNVSILARALRGLTAAASVGWGVLAGLGMGTGGAMARLAKLSRFVGAGGVLLLGLKALARFTLVGTAIWGAFEILDNWESIATGLEGIWARLTAEWARFKYDQAHPEEVKARHEKNQKEYDAYWSNPADKRGLWEKMKDGDWWADGFYRFLHGPGASRPLPDVPGIGAGGGWQQRQGGINGGIGRNGYSSTTGAAVDMQARGLAGSQMPATAAANAQPAIMGAATAPVTIQAQGPQVTFKQAPPVITLNAPITINMPAADPGAVGAAVSAHLNKVARGALHDGAGE